MGCDIHDYIETRTAADQPWTAAGQWEEYPDEAPYWVSAAQYPGRNYSLFAALAGVRNYDHVEPIAEPRGLPVDVTDEVRAEHDRWGGDAHTASHLTLTELTGWDGWNRVYPTSLMVTSGKRPHTRLTDDDMDRLRNACNYLGRLPLLGPDAWNLSTCSWTSDSEGWRTLEYNARLDLAVGVEWWRYLAELHRLALPVGPDNVRVVFWFDN